jgi:hypothetical protein
MSKCAIRGWMDVSGMFLGCLWARAHGNTITDPDSNFRVKWAMDYGARGSNGVSQAWKWVRIPYIGLS